MRREAPPEARVEFEGLKGVARPRSFDDRNSETSFVLLTRNMHLNMFEPIYVDKGRPIPHRAIIDTRAAPASTRLERAGLELWLNPLLLGRAWTQKRNCDAVLGSS